MLSGIFLLLAGWSSDIHAQSIFEVQFNESSEKMIGETEKNMSGESFVAMVIEGAILRYDGNEPTVGRAAISFFGEDGELLGTVLSEAIEVEPGERPLARRVSGERLAEAFNATIGERGFIPMRFVGIPPNPPLFYQTEPPPIMTDMNQEPPPIMMYGDEGHSYFEKVFWAGMDRDGAGIGVAFVPIIGRYTIEDQEELSLSPMMITGEFEK